MIREGASFDGYHLLRLLGRGGAGEVYLAQPPAGGPLREPVAIKIYRAARGEQVALELMRQAQAVAMLQHPQILPCYTDAAQGDDLGIVMAFAAAGSLGDTLNSRRPSVRLPLRPAVVARIVTQAARALADVHRQGMVHGDLKPTNLFTRPADDGSPIVAISDFGHSVLARAAVTELRENRFGQPPVWVTNQLTWAAPEQLRGNAVPASDQYGLAALAYFLLTGVRPVSAEVQALISSDAPRSIAPPSRLNPALDDEVDAVLFNALAPLPHHRFSDVADFAGVLEEALVAANATHGNASGAGSDQLRGEIYDDDASERARGTAQRTLAHMSYATSRAHKPAGRAMVLDDDDLGESPEEADGLLHPKRRRSLVATIALLVTVFAIVIGVLAFNPGGVLPARLDLAHLVGGNRAGAVQATSSPAKTTSQTQAESRLRAAIATRPVYSDMLTGTPATWTVIGKSVFFGSDHRLHVNNPSATPLFEDMPTSATIPKGAYVASVDVSLVAGATSGHAGMRFLVSTSAKGGAYYSYLITPDARFELWVQHPGTGPTFLTSGFVPSLKMGMGKTNTLAVLIDPTTRTLTLFANGTFVFQAPISHDISMAGRLGVVVPDKGVEAVFADFAVYNA